jgi:hypothetical protein
MYTRRLQHLRHEGQPEVLDEWAVRVRAYRLRHYMLPLLNAAFRIGRAIQMVRPPVQEF